MVERDAHVVRRIDAQTGLVSTVAGTGEAGFSGDGGPAAEAQLRQPHSIAFDVEGHLLVCDIGNGRVRHVNMNTGTISTLSGTGERGTTPDQAPLAGTTLRGPRSIATDDQGNAYLVLREGNAVFRLDLRARHLYRIAGTGERGDGPDGDPHKCRLARPHGVYVHEEIVYVTDSESHRVRALDFTGVPQ